MAFTQILFVSKLINIDMEFKLWLEATTQYVDKKIDPALLTFDEFWNLVNSCNKWHPSESYDYPITSFSFQQNKSQYPILVNRISINGINFEIRLKKKDLYKDKTYIKKTYPDGEFVTDENNQLVYYTEEELNKLEGYRRFLYSFAVFDKEQKVAYAQDEWGALLVGVAPEYRRFGLGSILTKLAWEAEPGKDTGGCTNAGARITRKVHTDFVRDYLQKGFYSFLVKQGKITAERANQIINSAKLKQKKDFLKKDLGTDDPENWLLFNEYGFFILYDKKFKEMYQEEDTYWADKCIKAMGDVGPMPDKDNYRLRNLGGENDQLKKWMVYLCASWVSEKENDKLYVYEDDIKYVDTRFMKINNSRENGWVELITQPAEYKSLSNVEKSWRKKFDKYEEFHDVLIERAVSKYQD